MELAYEENKAQCAAIDCSGKRCTSTSYKKLKKLPLCWPHYKAVDNPERTQALRFDVDAVREVIYNE